MRWTKVSRGREEWPYREAHTHNSLNRDTSAMNLYKMWLLETAFVERISVFLCHTIIPLFQHLSCSKTQIGHYRKTPSIGSMIYDLSNLCLDANINPDKYMNVKIFCRPVHLWINVLMQVCFLKHELPEIQILPCPHRWQTAVLFEDLQPWYWENL